jgi:hypothetical protein
MGEKREDACWKHMRILKHKKKNEEQTMYSNPREGREEIRREREK